jgi:hypothetical protein
VSVHGRAKCGCAFLFGGEQKHVFLGHGKYFHKKGVAVSLIPLEKVAELMKQKPHQCVLLRSAHLHVVTG